VGRPLWRGSKLVDQPLPTCNRACGLRIRGTAAIADAIDEAGYASSTSRARPFEFKSVTTRDLERARPVRGAFRRPLLVRNGSNGVVEWASADSMSALVQTLATTHRHL